MFGSRVLVLVPHPDDEIVGFCAAIGRAKAEGAEIFALYLTNGCIGIEERWPWQRKAYKADVDRRRAEAEKAASLLGIKPVGFARRASRSLRFEMDEAAREIKTAVESHKIDQLWIPAYEGGHADHDVLSGLCAALFPEEKRRKARLGNEIADAFRAPTGHLLDSILEFSEYNFAGGVARSQNFPAPNGTETILRLSGEEKAFKKEALALYVSEQKNLGYVETNRETFRPLALYDYSKPPHKGTVWYARHQWVPFRHPRVDFTRPEEVSAGIEAFRKKGVGGK